jgi:hypothetical protein
MHLFRRGARTGSAGSRGVKGTHPTQESAESACSIATLAAARVAKTRKQHAAHNDYPGWFASTVLLGGSHPVVFAALVGVACAIPNLEDTRVRKALQGFVDRKPQPSAGG